MAAIRPSRSFRASKRASEVEYAIRDIAAHAQELERQGRKVIYLNIGDPVKYGFETPPHVRAALAKAVEDGYNWYSPSAGLPELRRAIAEKEGKDKGIDISADDVIITLGTSEAILFLTAALTDPGDELLVPGPCYPPYISYPKLLGVRPVVYRTVEGEGWRLDLEDLESKVTERTRGMVVINPNNPTGALYEERLIKEAINIAAQYNLVLISDEIYDAFVYEGRFVSPATVSGDVPVIILNGFSKKYCMTGWRLGYAIFCDPQGRLEPVREAVERLARVRLSPNTPAQKAAVEALRGPQDHLKAMVEELKARTDYAYERLAAMEGEIHCARPRGAFYVFPKVLGIGRRWASDEEFALKLLRGAGVLVVHGSGFDPSYGAGHFRAVTLPPMPTLEAALNAMEAWLRSK